MIKVKMKFILILLFVNIVKCDIPYINLFQFENITIASIDTICLNFTSKNTKISESCRQQFEIVCENTTLLMTISDASAKFPYSGLGYSTRSDYGNFDQCLSVDHKYDHGRILGEYCAIGLIIPDLLGNATDTNSAFKLAVCRPDGCTAKDYNTMIAELSLPVIFADGACVTAESNNTYSVGDIIVLLIFAIIIAFMLVSTTYDVYLYNSGNRSIHPLLIAFSMLSNGRKLLHISKHSNSKEQIEVFHGMRVISMWWIVAGHGMGMYQYSPVTNVESINTWASNMMAFHMTAAPLSVDTFFYMSGFLLAFQYFKGKSRTVIQQMKSVPQMILHRYLRLTPAMLMIYLVVITFYVHLGSGPLWTTSFNNFENICKTYWWRFFLYIQNYFDFSETCLPQTWYLSADMQLFLLSPLILIPLSYLLNKFGFKSTMYALLMLNIIWTILPMVLKLCIREYTNGYDTHSRFIDYYIGVMLGLYMRAKMDKPFLYMINEGYRSVINLLTWIVIILGMLAVIICYQDQQLHHGFESHTVFQALMRPAWCIGLSWITYSSYHGRGGFVSWILYRPIFQVIGRLTYCIYLLHISVIIYYMGTSRTKSYFNEYMSFYQFCGHYIVSVILATFWTLAFESPLIIIEKYLLGGATQTKKSNTPQVRTIEESSKSAAIDIK